MKKRNNIMLIPLICTISVLAVGCSKSNSEESLPDEVTPVSSSVTVNSKAPELIYGTLNLSYADFYYGEINNIEPDLNASKGQYELSSKVDAAGYRSEGMYDAVTSATKQKSTRFEATYYEEVGEGANILGVSNVNVAISSDLYSDVQNAIASGTVCNNELVELVSTMTLTEDVPSEYKVINSDGTISKTIGETQVLNDVSYTFTTVSSWGNYQFTFEGVDIDAMAVMGAIIETEDGKKYGLEHEDNLWLKASEVSFCAQPFTEPHGNEVAFKRFEDIQGKTIVKFTYLIANAADIEIPVNAFVNLLLDDSYSIVSDSDVIYSTKDMTVEYTVSVPDDSSYSLSAIKCGRNACDISNVVTNENNIILTSDFKPGKYTFIFEDSTYQALTFTKIIDSGLSDGDVIFNGTTFEFTKDCGLTALDYINNFESLTVNSEKVNAKGLASLIFDESGNLLIDAVIEGKDETTPVFTDGKNEVTITSTAFPSVTFEIEK